LKDLAKELANQISKEYGPGAAITFDDEGLKSGVTDFLSTGITALDFIIGRPGLPCGRLTEILGVESSGKTTIVLKILGSTQKAGGVAVLFDVENSFDPLWSKKNGCDPNNLVYSQPDTLEDVFAEIHSMISFVKTKKNKPYVTMVIDSIAGISTKAEIEGEIGDRHIAEHARLLTPQLRQVLNEIKHEKIVFIITNQMRASFGVMYGEKEHSFGGRALKHFATLRLKVYPGVAVKKSGKVIGTECRVRVIKNKVAPPFREATIPIIFEEGISEKLALLDLARRKGIITSTGGMWNYGDIRFRRSDAPQEVIDEIEKKIRSELKT